MKINMKMEKSKDSLLWRIIFGILLIIFALISLSRFNATAALLYIFISIFIFIPGRIFKIEKNWIKILIVIILIFGVGLINFFFINSGAQNIEEYVLGQEFILPSNSNFSVVVTKVVEKYEIQTPNNLYKTDGKFLLIYLNTSFVGDVSSLPEDNLVGFSMSFGLKDSNNNEYPLSDLNTSDFPQTQILEPGESFYLFNINKNVTGLKLIFSEEKNKNFVVVDLGM